MKRLSAKTVPIGARVRILRDTPDGTEDSLDPVYRGLEGRVTSLPKDAYANVEMWDPNFEEVLEWAFAIEDLEVVK